MEQQTELKIKKFLRTQLNWLVTGKITEDNFKYKLADCKMNYPSFDYEAEYFKMTEELKNKELN